MRVYVGTSGFSYPEWRGRFYPEKLSRERMLSHYAERLSAVEINNTFYRMPRPEGLRGWAERVPQGFRFALKAPRRITHVKRLRDAAEEARFFQEVASVLGEHRGPLLFQLPPGLRVDLALLREFLAQLSPEAPAAFEFRHSSWHRDDVLEALREAGAAWCVADSDPERPAPVEATARFGYLRLRRPGYDDADLAAWAERIQKQPWESAYVFFKHEDAAAGPALALRLRERLRS